MGNTVDTASAPAADQPAKVKVFISYSRKDTTFADRIKAALEARGFEVAIDRREILVFEVWWKRIETLITRADTVVFVLSPDSVVSEVALKEVNFAASLNKRFAPIVCRTIDDKKVPEALAKFNLIFFDDETQFEAKTDQLGEGLRTDIDWVRRHTELGERARSWSLAKRPDGDLLRSPALEEAERWIASRPEGAPAPTAETQDFIRLSRASATWQRNVLTASLVSGLILAVGLAGYAFYQRSQVQQELDRANQALAESINNSLDLENGAPLTPRQSQALWQLAVSDEAVKNDYLSTVVKSPENTVRAARGFGKISRALGLLRPDPDEAKKL